MKLKEITLEYGERHSISASLKLALLMVGCVITLLASAQVSSAQCQYDWRQDALPFFGNRAPSPEVGMTNEKKIQIAQACDKLFKQFFNNSKSPDNDVNMNRPCGEPLDTPFFKQFYKPKRHPKSINDDIMAQRRWYEAFDCATRQAVDLLVKRRIEIPDGLVVHRMPKPTASGNYPSPTIIPRTGAFEPRAVIIIPEFNDNDFARFSPQGGLRGVILSSIGEILHERKAGESYYTLSGKTPRTRRCSDVSPRACESIYFFVADVFAGYVAGLPYAKEILDEYQQYLGPGRRFIGTGRRQ